MINKLSMCLKSSLHTTFFPQSHSVIQQILLSVLGSWNTSMKKTAQNPCPYGTYTPVEGIKQNKRGSRKRERERRDDKTYVLKGDSH